MYINCPYLLILCYIHTIVNQPNENCSGLQLLKEKIPRGITWQLIILVRRYIILTISIQFTLKNNFLFIGKKRTNLFENVALIAFNNMLVSIIQCLYVRIYIDVMTLL